MTEGPTWARVRERLRADWTQPVRRPSEAVLEERARRLARAPEGHELAPKEEVICVRVGGALVIWPTVAVRSVDPLPSWVRVPSGPRHLLGLSRVDGALGPVFDIGPLITGRATELGEEARLVTLTGAAPALSFVVAAVHDTFEAPAEITDAPEDAPSFVLGVAPGGELALDPDALLADPRLVVDDSDAL